MMGQFSQILLSCRNIKGYISDSALIIAIAIVIIYVAVVIVIAIVDIIMMMVMLIMMMMMMIVLSFFIYTCFHVLFIQLLFICLYLSFYSVVSS